MKKTRVLVSDFQFLTRSGLVNLVNEKDEFELVGVLDHIGELIEKTILLRPNVVVMDYDGRDPVLLSVMKQILESNATNVLIVSNEVRKDHIKGLLDLGIKGIVTKSCSRQEIINAIEAVSKNARFYCNRILEVVMVSDSINEDSSNCEPTSLSPREYEVLRLITKGMKTQQIAEKLNLSIHTINSHRKNILKKLNLKSPTELVVYALESGMVKG